MKPTGDKSMSDRIILTRANQIDWQILPGGFKYKFIATGDKFMTGLGLAQPGGGETWHRHTREVEETYYVLKGKGKICWRSDGKEHVLEFSEGDAMYVPYGSENMFVNTGESELLLLFNITKAIKMRE
jgi:mannose-6-phosphate isomerase-like protein (cupin superfamily)